MKINPELDKKVLAALDSLDGIRRAEPGSFFYTRLKARLQRNERSVWEAIGSFLARPAIAMAGLSLVFLLNAVFLFRKQPQSTAVFPKNPASEQLATDNEYILASSSSFEYENLDLNE